MSNEYDPTGDALRSLRELQVSTTTHFGLLLYDKLHKACDLETERLNAFLGSLHNRRLNTVVDSKFTMLLTEFVKEFNTLDAVSGVLNVAHSEAMDVLTYKKVSLPQVLLFLSSNIFGDAVLEFQVK